MRNVRCKEMNRHILMMAMILLTGCLSQKTRDQQIMVAASVVHQRYQKWDAEAPRKLSIFTLRGEQLPEDVRELGFTEAGADGNVVMLLTDKETGVLVTMKEGLDLAYLEELGFRPIETDNPRIKLISSDRK